MKNVLRCKRRRNYCGAARCVITTRSTVHTCVSSIVANLFAQAVLKIMRGGKVSKVTLQLKGPHRMIPSHIK